MNILIVDDEAVTTKALAAGIDWKDCGIDGEVKVAHDARSALLVIQCQQIDLVLCDVEMPGENGIELMQKVHEICPEIAVIFLTCHAKFEYAQEAIRLGCEDYILKPAPYDEIAAVVKKTVERILAQRESDEIKKYGESFIHQKRQEAQLYQGGKRSNAEVVEDTAEYILNNIGDSELSVGKLAERCFLNEDYLNRIFKRAKGISLNQYIIQERMNLAQKLLVASDLSISAVAEQCGYSNYPYFASTFKRYFNCTPSQYQQEHKKTD